MSHAFPNDPLGRAWIEMSGVNPELVAECRSALVAFLAYDRNQYARFIGTGFILCGKSDVAIVITARHVLIEGVVQAQRPVPSHEPTAIIIPKYSKIPSLHPRQLRAVWMGKDSAALLNVLHVSYNPATDVALCVIGTQKDVHDPFVPISVPLHPVIPCIGEVVRMVSCDKMEVSEIEPPEDHTGLNHTLGLHLRVSIRVGTVTAVYPTNGFRQYGWPCFTTSIPAEPGMSGGFVSLVIPNTTVAACGVVSADISPSEARTSQMLRGESVVACSWPALALNVPEKIGGRSKGSNRTILEMVQMGNVPMPIGGIEHLQIASTPEGETALKIDYPRRAVTTPIPVVLT